MDDIKMKEFYDVLVKLCSDSITASLQLSNNIPMSSQDLFMKGATGTHKSIIYTLVFYKWTNETNMLDAGADLLIKMVKQQSLPTANKRMAIIFVNFFFSWLGYYINCSQIGEWLTLLNIIAASKDDEELHQMVKTELEKNLGNWFSDLNPVEEYYLDSLFDTIKEKLKKPAKNTNELVINANGFVKLINVLSKR